MQQRDDRKETGREPPAEQPAAGPVRYFEPGRELLLCVCEGLSSEDRYLAEQRALGREWADLAAELGAEPDTLRLRLRRALNRVAAGPGLQVVGPCREVSRGTGGEP